MRNNITTSNNQQMLFSNLRKNQSPMPSNLYYGATTSNLETLIKQEARFPTIYADPPWAYNNSASRGAAANHYPTMSLEAICNEPVKELAAENAHLHLWTTNAFHREAYKVIEAWGFQYKSCLVWVKPQIGMGNYWRVSHEYLMLGVRGSMRFRNRSLKSWVEAGRQRHSQKPALIRSLIEEASPGPYLELYGREIIPGNKWTVYGNQIE